MSLPRNKINLPDVYVEDFNLKNPCSKQKTHSILWDSELEFLPQLFEADFIQYWGYCTACHAKMRAVWTFHNIIQEKT